MIFCFADQPVGWNDRIDETEFPVPPPASRPGLAVPEQRQRLLDKACARDSDGAAATPGEADIVEQADQRSSVSCDAPVTGQAHLETAAERRARMRRRR
ncbi:MAG: hypothetical protein R3D33_09110 [Hyphomicrobiaceae bacterium]